MTAGPLLGGLDRREAETAGLSALSDADFCERLQARFGWRVGRLTRPARRLAYPLKLLLTRESVRSRLVLIGNAAHTLHPVAGQGLNLGLRDVAALAEVIADAAVPRADPGADGAWTSTAACAGGIRPRSPSTDALAWLFVNPWLPVRLARGLGLLGLDLVPGARRLVARRFMGLGGSRRGWPAACHSEVQSMSETAPESTSISSSRRRHGGCGPGLRLPRPRLAHRRGRGARAPARVASGEVDLRVSALNRASQRILSRLGVWGRIVALGTSPYREMQVWDAVGGGQHPLRLPRTWASRTSGISSRTGSPSSPSGSARRIAGRRAALPGEIAAAVVEPDAAVVALADGRRRARLLVGPTGATPACAQLLGIGTQGWDYDQTAIVANVEVADWHKGDRLAALPAHRAARLPTAARRALLHRLVGAEPRAERADGAAGRGGLPRRAGRGLRAALGAIGAVGPRAAFPCGCSTPSTMCER
jgi:2-polyprenyl-6-methoxyphenol hydroxylase-like FAD-dependent oxidoreductase